MVDNARYFAEQSISNNNDSTDLLLLWRGFDLTTGRRMRDEHFLASI